MAQRSKFRLQREDALRPGREAQSTGPACADALAKALTSLRRFRCACRIQQVGRIISHRHGRLPRRQAAPISSPGPRRICGTEIRLRRGRARRSFPALGIVRIHNPPTRRFARVDRRAWQPRQQQHWSPLGSLALQDIQDKSLKRAERIVSNDLSDVAQLKAAQGRAYAVGGTWRALARIVRAAIRCR